MNSDYNNLVQFIEKVSYFHLRVLSDPRNRGSKFQHQEGKGYLRLMSFIGELGKEDPMSSVKSLAQNSLTYIKYESNRKTEALRDFEEIKERYATYRKLMQKYNELTFVISDKKHQDIEREIINTFGRWDFYATASQTFIDEFWQTVIVGESFWTDMKELLDENEKQIDFILTSLNWKPKNENAGKKSKFIGTSPPQQLYFDVYFKLYEDGVPKTHAIELAAKKVGYSASNAKVLTTSFYKGKRIIKYKGKQSIYFDQSITPYKDWVKFQKK